MQEAWPAAFLQAVQLGQGPGGVATVLFHRSGESAGCDIRLWLAWDELGTDEWLAFHKRGGSAGYDIIYFRRTPLAKGDDIKSALSEICLEE